MSRRTLAFGFAAVFVLVAATLAIYFTSVGLDKADKLGSALGVFLGLAALTLSVYLAIIDRRPDRPSSVRHPASGSVVHNRIDGGTIHGLVIQGRDISQVTGESSPSPQGPPAQSPPPR